MGEEADWANLVPDVLGNIGDRLLADGEFEDYVNFRSVCKPWRNHTGDPKVLGVTDARFHPKTWVVLNSYGYLSGRCAISMLNLRTCRVVEKEIPTFHDYHFFTVTDGGLLVLGEHDMPYCRAVLLNIFTGSTLYFMVPICAEAVAAATLTTSPELTTRLFVSNLYNFVGWADDTSYKFQEYRLPWYSREYARSMIQIDGVVHVALTDGCILSSTATDAAAAGSSSTRRLLHSRDDMITMSTTIRGGILWPEIGAPSLMEDDHYSLLADSTGELLLVSLRIDLFDDHGVARVHKVDTERKMLEPVHDIGERAIFASRARTFFIDASFPTIEAGCVYFVESTNARLFRSGTLATSFRLADQRQETIKVVQGSGPRTLVQVLADYCMLIPNYEFDFFTREWLNGRSVHRERQIDHGRWCSAFNLRVNDVTRYY